MREQTELKFFVGYPQFNSKFEQAVIRAASALCGGCYVGRGAGYWTEDGADHKEHFQGELIKEHTFHLVLSCENHKVDRVYATMRAVIAANADFYSIETDWVHVQRTEFIGMHFSVSETKGDMSAVDYRDIVSPGTRGAR